MYNRMKTETSKTVYKATEHIVHELAHTRVANHSQKFWNVVSGILPDYKERRRWLKKNGDLLGIPEAKENKTGPAAS